MSTNDSKHFTQDYVAALVEKEVGDQIYCVKDVAEFKDAVELSVKDKLEKVVSNNLSDIIAGQLEDLVPEKLEEVVSDVLDNSNLVLQDEVSSSAMVFLTCPANSASGTTVYNNCFVPHLGTQLSLSVLDQPPIQVPARCAQAAFTLSVLATLSDDTPAAYFGLHCVQDRVQDAIGTHLDNATPQDRGCSLLFPDSMSQNPRLVGAL
ncbi:hypothetical protein B0J12DRAFT_743279 [Macrophomina phaseolina]|uniref:Uncharacterized protein n=1 Tax=Macrophomina phaseolina TaxID=35725 RepID=A0ABQ8G4M7_9PEZI|nr:hypothetical protein B0J12DRAFT_743279 [Macrophomina phaseolina]